MNKTYNTHLVQLWLDNNRNNYMACGAITKKAFNFDPALIDWLKGREYGGDKEKIVLKAEALYLDAIRQTIKDNMHATHA